jgi:archaellum component FlaC
MIVMDNMDFNNGKIERVLGIYTKLVNGGIVNKQEEAIRYRVNEKSIQRDIDDIRNFMELSVQRQGGD